MELQHLLGRLIHSPEIKEFLSHYHLPQNPNPEYDAYGNLFWVRINNEEKTIRCLFTGYVRGDLWVIITRKKISLFCTKSPFIHQQPPMAKFLK